MSDTQRVLLHEDEWEILYADTSEPPTERIPALTVGSLFAGVGGFDIAAEDTGMHVLWQSENDKYASQVLEHHWPGRNLGDIRDIHSPPKTDILAGGFPCQSYSVAGNRGGLAEDRGALWWEFHRLIREGQPTWVVAENVPGLLSSSGGRDFTTIISSLVQLGYGVVWRVLDAQWFGVPQRRRRVFIVGHSGGEPRPGALALSESLSGHPKPSRKEGSDVAGTLETRPTSDRLRAEPGHLIVHATQDPIVSEDRAHALSSSATQGVIAFVQNQRDEVRILDVPGALSAQPGVKQQTYIAIQGTGTSRGIQGKGWKDDGTQFTLNTVDRHGVFYDESVRRLTPLECLRLQGFPDTLYDGIPMSNTQKYRQAGNAVAVPVVRWVLQRITTIERQEAQNSSD